MNDRRIVEQERACNYMNWCDGGKRTPRPLNLFDGSDKNKMGDYCEGCPELFWGEVRVVEKKKTGLVYINREQYVGKTIGDVLRALGFRGVEDILVCNEYGAPPLGNIQTATPEYVIGPKDVAVTFQHG